MFCFQCEQTSHGVGCRDAGVCGKDHPTASLQDLLLHVTKGVAMYAQRARGLGVIDAAVDDFVLEALFTTVTNVNFDYAHMRRWIDRGVALRDGIRARYEAACAQAGTTCEALSGAASWTPTGSAAALVRAGEAVSIQESKRRHGDDIAGLIELYTYGLKGAAAYAEHAKRLGHCPPEHTARYIEALDFLTRPSFEIDELLGRCLEAGEINYQAMELLDTAHTSTYGHPEPTEVRVEPIRGKAIVVSGHDLRDLKDVLEQTAGTGVNVYTHGEMLPAHGYPAFKKYPHLVGNYGGPWQDQAKEFESFPGAILLTTNCIQRPKGSYFDRIFTSGLVSWPGVTHLSEKDFSGLVAAAKAQKGFTEDGPNKTVTVGFGRKAVLDAADTIVNAVKEGAIRHFFLVGGCDGAKSGRNYYTEFASSVPDDCIVLTLACGKYRFNKRDFGTLGGLPRLLDIGQCNDAYSAIQIASALATAFECGVNDLPLSMILSWYEQKAVAILLTLLHLGVKNIRLGPSLPAFITPKVLDVLVESYNLMPIGEAQADLKAILGN